MLARLALVGVVLLVPLLASAGTPVADAQALISRSHTGRWVQTKGVHRSLFLLPTLREEIEILLQLDPRSVRAHSLAGNVYTEVPELFGGDKEKAEEHFKKGLAIDPKFTVLRIDLARLYITTDRYAEARRELQRVIDETAPTFVADWTVKDRPRARQLLESIRAK